MYFRPATQYISKAHNITLPTNILRLRQNELPVVRIVYLQQGLLHSMFATESNSYSSLERIPIQTNSYNVTFCIEKSIKCKASKPKLKFMTSSNTGNND